MKQKKHIVISILVTLFVLLNNITVFAAPKTKQLPSIPSGLKTTNITSSEIDISWSSAAYATGYKIYRATPNDSNYVLLTTTTSTSYKNTGLNSSTAYWYYVAAYNSYGSSGASTHLKAITLAPPVVTTTSKTVLGFTTYYYSGDSSSYNSMTANSTLINQIATDTYTTDGLGNLSGLVPTSQITYANSNGITSLAMITNNFSGDVAKTLLESSVNRQALINNISASLKANGYKGVNVDLEGIYYYDRSYFTTFMSELYNALKPQGFTVTLDVPAKTYDSTTDGWSGAFDYASLAKYCDSVVIMTYDEHYPGGTPGPVASIGWVQNVVKYAVTVIPSTKILLGTAAYGYDWSSNGTKAYSISGCYNLAATYGAQVLWDTTSECPYFTYTDASGISHTVWFENSTSLGYKLDVVNNSNLAGIGLWRLGLEDSNYWATIKTKFNK